MIFKSKTTLKPLEDLDFADDLTLVSRTHQQSSADRPEDKPEEDRGDDIEHPKPLTGAGEWRRST